MTSSNLGVSSRSLLLDMNSLNIGIDSWIIQDGNYKDFVVGQEAQFAMEFSSVTLTVTDSRTRFIEESRLNRYRICGEVIFRDEKVWVLDFGFRTFQEAEPPQYATVGQWVQGDILLGIDPFFYSAYLKNVAGMPDLKYPFRVDRILLNATPWIEAPAKNMIVRDERRESFQEVPRTDAWNDDGHATYILRCSLRTA